MRLDGEFKLVLTYKAGDSNLEIQKRNWYCKLGKNM